MELYNYFLIVIFQVMTIYNAINLGWSVKKIGHKKYKLSKTFDNIDDFQINDFINKITNGKI